MHLRCAGAYAGVKPSLERLVRYTDLDADGFAEVAALLEAMPIPEPHPPEEATNADAADTAEAAATDGDRAS